MKKIVIIGGGISGLSAGIYARQNGFETEIYEKHIITGGECTGWDRKGYHIDNCIHWLTGINKDSDMFKIWKNIGAINDDTQMIYEPYFYGIENNDKEIYLYTDLDRSRKEFLEISPIDSDEINKFFDNVKLAETLFVPTEKAVSDMSIIDFMKIGKKMKKVSVVMKNYGKDNIEDLANRFKSPIIRDILNSYYSHNFMGFTLLLSYAFLSGKTGAIPVGGSKKMVESITEKYLSLGGKLYTGKEVEKIIIDGKLAKGIRLADNTEIEADYVICALDTNITFSKLLDSKYMEKKMQKTYKDVDGYKVNSAFQTAFGVIGEEETGAPSGSFIFSCDELTIGTKKESKLCLRFYDYDESIYPKNKRVIQCSFIQYRDDFEYWKKLNKKDYIEEKKRLALEIQNRIIKKYPKLKNRLILLDTFTPLTYERYCGAYQGSYMSFFPQKGKKSHNFKNTIKNLDNVILAGQWLSANGGLPIAATSGKFAVQKICKLENIIT